MWFQVQWLKTHRVNWGWWFYDRQPTEWARPNHRLRKQRSFRWRRAGITWGKRFVMFRRRDRNMVREAL